MYQVGCLDVYQDEVFAIIESAAPPAFSLRRARSYADAEQQRIANDADFLLTGWAPVPVALFKENGRLRLIQKFGVGYDKIDLQAAALQGVPVAIAAGTNANPVAELAIGLMIGVMRHLWYAMSELRAGQFRKAELRATSYQLRDKKIGLVGMGHVGRVLTRHLLMFGCTVQYYDLRHLPEQEEQALHLQYQPLDVVLATSDILSLHVPLTPQTHQLLNRARIGAMKPGSVIINTARGELIDEEALADALDSGQVLGVGLDVMAKEPPVPSSRLLQHPRVLVTPHIGGSVIDNVLVVAQHCFANMERVLRGEPLPDADFVNRGMLVGGYR